MANISPTTAAIESIAKNLAQACAAARGLDGMVSQDLQSLLRIAGCECDRVRKASRKAARTKAASKAAAAAAKKPAAKRVRAASVAKSAMQGPARGRRKAAFANGIAH